MARGAVSSVGVSRCMSLAYPHHAPPRPCLHLAGAMPSPFGAGAALFDTLLPAAAAPKQMLTRRATVRHPSQHSHIPLARLPPLGSAFSCPSLSSALPFSTVLCSRLCMQHNTPCKIGSNDGSDSACTACLTPTAMPKPRLERKTISHHALAGRGWRLYSAVGWLIRLTFPADRSLQYPGPSFDLLSQALFLSTSLTLVSQSSSSTSLPFRLTLLPDRSICQH